MNTTANTMPRVFISYSHDSDTHKDRVLALSDHLRQDGIDCHLDQYEVDPEQGWPRWAHEQIENADLVLLVCTDIYGQRVRGQGESGKGKGAKWEGAIITQELYDSEVKTAKFIPVLFLPDDAAHIPILLRGVNHYVINTDTDAGYDILYRRLTGQHDTPIPPLGEPRSLPLRQRKYPTANP